MSLRNIFLHKCCFYAAVLLASVFMLRPLTAGSAGIPSAKLRGDNADKRAGKFFEFGCYPQELNGDVKPIIWRVLKREKDCMLVIALRGLDCKPYHNKYCAVTWADCSLRRWLNGEFYYKAFNEQERRVILPSIIRSGSGPATEDRVFLLSIDEVNSLFAGEIDRRAWPTEFAVKQHACVKNSLRGCWWWLRSNGGFVGYAALVAPGGYVSDVGCNVDLSDFCAVRPALKIAF